MNYVLRCFGVVKLCFQKLRMRGKLILEAPIYQYHISSTTHISCSNRGMINLGKIGTSSNVHLVAYGGVLSIGNGTSFNRNVIVVSRDRITIGSNTIFGPNVCIYDHDHAFGAEGVIPNEYKLSAVEIGSNVWVGAGTIILRGTVIGDHSIIGAGCVITGYIPEKSKVTADNRVLKIEKLHF